MFFGQKLREIRLKQGFGLRKFAGKINMMPSEYSNIECGYVKPPGYADERGWIRDVLDVLEFKGFPVDMLMLVKEWYEPFVMQRMPEVGMPIYPRTAGVEFLTKKKLIELYDYLEQIRIIHNRIADAYNRKADEDNRGKSNVEI